MSRALETERAKSPLLPNGPIAMLRGDLLTDATLFAISSFKLIPVVAGFLYLVCGLASGPFAFKIFRRDYVPANARNVPWGLDVALIVFLIFSFVSPVVVVATASAIKGELPKTTSSPVVESEEEQTQEVSNVSENATDQEEPELAKDERDMSTLHPVARMLLRAKDSPRFPLVLALFLFGVIVVAPVTEELVFRVVAQGACERFASEKFGATTGLVPALAAIVPPALIFALLHFAPAEDLNAPASAQKLVESSIANVSGNLLSLCLILAILRFVCRGDKAKSPDEDVPSTRDGSPLARFALEFYRGAVLFLFAAPIIFPVKSVLQKIFPMIVVDPIPIFIFALCEGVVYHKTRSYPTVLGMHVALNSVSFLALCSLLA